VFEEYNKLAEKIKEISKGKPVYYLANPGNMGDGLIRAGAIKFFLDKGIDYKELTLKKSEWIVPFIKGGTLIYGGGGLWADVHKKHNRLINKLINYAGKRFKVIILPSTFEKKYDFPPNVTVFCRDKYESQQNMPDATFCHDMAFFLGKISAPNGSGVGYFYRSDEESLQKFDIPEMNRDISAEGNHFTDINHFIDAISKYETLHTDRLHVCICACLLGRKVHFYPNSYFKNRAIFDTSIKDKFENVIFYGKEQS